jgi:hypothetical protein
MKLTRKEFLSTMVTAAAGAAGAALLVACGSSSGDDDSGGDCLMNGTSVQFSANHGHVLAVSKDHITMAVAKTYTTTGATADHTHNVTISAPAFAMLTSNTTVMTVTTTTDNHTHNVTVSCA